ncbi:hypothetical protein R1flu_010646 [Riccia fluitans]|uniref:Uncharacterized protein n=1 Tax=Riccia fluitans TaxID=41844 RepID=A0ABD1Z6L9_9MARC
MVKRVEEKEGTDATKPTIAVYDSFVRAQIKAEQGCIVAPTLETMEFEQGRSPLATQVAELESENDKQGELLEWYETTRKELNVQIWELASALELT